MVRAWRLPCAALAHLFEWHDAAPRVCGLNRPPPRHPAARRTDRRDMNLAAKARQRIEDMMDRASILALASHDTSILRQYCNRAILLRQGSIVPDDRVDDIA